MSTFLCCNLALLTQTSWRYSNKAKERKQSSQQDSQGRLNFKRHSCTCRTGLRSTQESCTSHKKSNCFLELFCCTSETTSEKSLPTCQCRSAAKALPERLHHSFSALLRIFQAHTEKDKDLRSKAWTSPSITLDRWTESLHTQGQTVPWASLPVLQPCTSTQRWLSGSCLLVLVMLH